MAAEGVVNILVRRERKLFGFDLFLCINPVLKDVLWLRQWVDLAVAVGAGLPPTQMAWLSATLV